MRIFCDKIRKIMKIEKFLNGDFITMPSQQRSILLFICVLIISKLIKFEKTTANSFTG